MCISSVKFTQKKLGWDSCKFKQMRIDRRREIREQEKKIIAARPVRRVARLQPVSYDLAVGLTRDRARVQPGNLARTTCTEVASRLDKRN